MSSIYRAVVEHSRAIVVSSSSSSSRRRSADALAPSVAQCRSIHKEEEARGAFWLRWFPRDIKRTGCGLVALDYISIVHRPVHPHCRWLGGGNGGGIGARNGGNGGGPPGIPR